MASRWQDDHLLLQLLGVAMSHQGPQLLLEDEDGGRNGDEDRKDGDDCKVKKIQNSMVRVLNRGSPLLK